MIPIPPGVQQQLNRRCPCYAKPLAECDCQTDPNPELAEVNQALKAAISSLQDAYLITEKKFNKSLHVAVIDAMNACRDALERLDDETDEE